MSTPHKSQLYTEITEALHFLPKTFLTKGQNLDAALDAYRLHKTLSSSCLDLILMSYRYAHWFETIAQKFSNKKIKPAELLDLWLVGFTALLTRDKTPAFAIVSECVEVSKAKFGNHTSKITNAFLRHIERSKTTLLAELENNPTVILPLWLQKRWGKDHDLAALAKSFAARPHSGVGGFDAALKYQQIEWSESAFDNKSFQAMDPGSFAYCEWMASKVGNATSFVDTCAAPGGKSIFAHQLLKNKNSTAPDFILCESKSNRFNLLRENLKRWNIEAAPKNLQLLEWGKETPSAAIKDRKWDFVICDLPCSGSGTLFTRPDVLFRKWDESITSLKLIQDSILGEVLTLNSPKVFVSVCSTDTVEVDNISRKLGKKPDFVSWTQGAAACEGITAWYCER